MRVEAGERIPYAGCMVVVKQDGRAYLMSEDDRKTAKAIDVLEKRNANKSLRELIDENATP